MYQLKILRAYTDNNFTSGITHLIKDDVIIHTAVSLELPWRNNQKNISCIPARNYCCSKRYSQKHGHHLIIEDVPNRSYILFHPFNHINETEGCIGVGSHFVYHKNFKSPVLQDSRKTLNLMLLELPDHFPLIIENLTQTVMNEKPIHLIR